MTNTFFNVTTAKFDTDTIKTIGLGLSFIPKPRRKDDVIHKIREGVHNMTRNLRLAYSFKDKIDKDEKPRLKTPNPHHPAEEASKETEQFITHFVDDVDTIIALIEETDEKLLDKLCEDQTFIHNGCEKLRQRKDLLTKSSDKSVGATINEKEKYINDIKTDHLQDASTFKHQGHASTKKVKEIKTFIVQAYTSTLSKFLRTEEAHSKEPEEARYQQKLYNFLTNRCYNDYIASELYGLIKIHKLSPDQLKDLLHVKLKYRPIVAAHSSIFTNLSIYFNSFLKGYTSQNPINITDVNYVIKEIEDIQRDLPPDQKLIIIAADIATLYPKMTKETIIAAVRHFWPQIERYSDILSEFNLPQTIYLLNFMLTHNLINFNNNLYLQLKGVIMGDNAAPALAIIYLLYLEETNLQPYLNTNTLPNGSKPLLFRRYIDDVLLILSIHKDATTEEMTKAKNDFIDNYNNIHESIEVTHNSTIDTHHVTFLDLNIFTNEDHSKITMSTYFKEFHKFQYLHFDSFHHHSTHSAFIFGELDRYMTHSSNEDIYNITKKLFRERLLKAGYPSEYISKHFAIHYYHEEFRIQKLNKRATKIKPTNPFKKEFRPGYLRSVHNHPTIAKMKDASDKIIKRNLQLKEIVQRDKRERDKKQPKMKIDAKHAIVYKPRKTALKFPHHLLTADFNMPAIINSNPYFETLPEFLQDIVVSYSLCSSIEETLVKANLKDTPLAALDQEHPQYINDETIDYLLAETTRMLLKIASEKDYDESI